MTYRIEYLKSVVADDSPAPPKSAKRQDRRASESKLTAQRYELGKRLRDSRRGGGRWRVGD